MKVSQLRDRAVVGSFLCLLTIAFSALGQSPPLLLRGPYLQSATATNIVVRWRTDLPTETRVRFGTVLGNLTSLVADPVSTTEHEATLGGLKADTAYFYQIEVEGLVLVGGAPYTFTTVPTISKPTRIWAIGDVGTASLGAVAPLQVRDSYINYAGSHRTDVWLMLGDNAYPSGTDAQYQEAVFDVFQDLLRTTPVWPTLGNHETYSASPSGQIAYTEIFSLPQDGQAGGIASGNERYYSFDYGNIHFVCLDSETSGREVGGPMLTWLEQDLNVNVKDWLIAYWHSPPYSKGSHDSDVETNLVEMRERAVPILESYGVDLVLCGHSHSYERSFLLNGHYGLSGSLISTMVLDSGSGEPELTGAYLKSAGASGGEQGTVYVVAGSSGQTGGGFLNHPAMFLSLDRLGSMVIDVESNRLSAGFLRENGTVEDRFTILKGDQAPVILTPPSNRAIVEGGTTAFTVVATGTRPLHYQWLFNSAPLAGASNATLQLVNVQMAQAGKYSVVVSNALGSITSTEALLSVNTRPPCVLPSTGLVAWWALDGDGTNLVDNADLSLAGNPSFGLGKVGQAVWLDGATDQGETLGSPNLDLGGAAEGFTIELWINPISIVEPQPLVEWNNRQGSVGTQFWISTEGGSGCLFVALTEIGPTRLASPAGVVQPNQWTHVAFTYNRGTGLLRLYANGSQIQEANVGQITAQTTYDLFLGRRVAVSGTNYRYSGGMDEVTLYKRPLTAVEISAIFEAGAEGKCRSPRPPLIVTQPASREVVAGDATTFLVQADGTRPLIYQWLYNEAPIPGATGTSFTLTDVTLTDSGQYSVLVSNALGSVTSQPALLTVRPAPPCVTLASGVVSWWPMESDGQDLVNGHDLILLGAPSTAPGRVGQAIFWDGVNDEGEVPATSGLNIGAGDGFTIELWIKPASLVTPQPLLEWNNQQGDVGLQLWISQPPPLGNGVGTLFASFPEVSGAAHLASSPAGVLAANAWQHVALTYDRATGTERMYVNGAQVAQAALGSFTIQTTYALFLGRRVAVSGDNYWFTGGMDEVTLYDRALTAAEIRAITEAGSAGKCAPLFAPRIIAGPLDQTLLEGASAVFVVKATGTAPLNYLWFHDGLPLADASESHLTLVNVQLTQAGRYTVVVSNQVGSVTSAVATLTVNLPSPVVQVVSVQGGAGGAVTVPIELLANGTENALGFSLNFNPTILSLSSVELNEAAPSDAALVVNQDHAAAGRFGLVVALPAGEVWARGTQSLVRVLFNSVPTPNPLTTALTFGDVPTLRQISNREAKVLPSLFADGAVTLLAASFEGDVAPKPGGDRSLSVIDWVQLGRYVAGLDLIESVEEFQRADCAPRSQSGNGVVGVTDWVQAGRYATGLDPLTIAGGPTGQPDPNHAFQAQMAIEPPSDRTVRIEDVLLVSGATSSVSVNTEAQGNENAFGFSLTFDPVKLRFLSASRGRDAGGAILNVNTNQADIGHIGLALALPTARVLAVGEQELVVLRFRVDGAAWGTTTISFTDSPVRREISDATAEPLSASYNSAVLNLKAAGLVLSYNRSGGTLLLSWAIDGSSGFELETSSQLSGAPWTRVDVVPIPIGVQFLVTLPIAEGQAYYRMHRK